MADYLFVYDINTDNADGEKRLRQIAKLSIAFGIRVQKSVFESSLAGDQLVQFKSKVEGILDRNCDSVRIYQIQRIVDVIGVQPIVPSIKGTMNW